MITIEENIVLILSYHNHYDFAGQYVQSYSVKWKSYYFTFFLYNNPGWDENNNNATHESQITAKLQNDKLVEWQLLHNRLKTMK